MTIWQAFLLGIVQGIAEFLPISSSGHLALGQYLLGFEHLQDYILFDLVCHLGTLIAILYVFFPLMQESLNIRCRRFWQVVLGTLPLFPLIFILKPIKSLFDQPQVLGPCFLASAGLLFASLQRCFPFRNQTQWPDSFIIGIFQAIAILPGISRSGATISAARLLGWQKEQAIQFSFLLAIPAILGGAVWEGWQAWQNPHLISWNALNPWPLLVGFCTSCVVGYLSLWILIRMVIQDKWRYFAWYCLILGMVTTLYFNLFKSYGT
jgi:undecaprenyl-diphosphatase